MEYYGEDEYRIVDGDKVLKVVKPVK